MTFLAILVVTAVLVFVWKMGSRVGRYLGEEEAQKKAGPKREYSPLHETYFSSEGLREMEKTLDGLIRDRINNPHCGDQIAERPVDDKRTITLVGGPISGSVVHFSDAELKRHDYRLDITATLPDASQFVGTFQVQGDLGLFCEEVDK